MTAVQTIRMDDMSQNVNNIPTQIKERIEELKMHVSQPSADLATITAKAHEKTRIQITEAIRDSTRERSRQAAQISQSIAVNTNKTDHLSEKISGMSVHHEEWTTHIEKTLALMMDKIDLLGRPSSAFPQGEACTEASAVTSKDDTWTPVAASATASTPSDRSQPKGISPSSLTCLQRLDLLARNKDEILFASDAEDILENLGQLIDRVTEPSDLTKSDVTCPARPKLPIDPIKNTSRTQSMLRMWTRKLRKALSLAQSITINPSPELHPFRSQVSQQIIPFHSPTAQWKSQIIQTTSQTYFRRTTHLQIVMLARTLLAVNDQYQKDQASFANDSRRTIEWKIIVLPLRKVIESKISILYYQIFNTLGVWNGTPSLTFHATIPDDSAIFRAIRYDSFESIIRMFENGQANPFDCDSLGRSLMGYAIKFYRLDVCKYLIDQGLDLDAVERHSPRARSLM
jgi:hypothetical protein